MAIISDLKDPRIRDVTVTYVEMSGDLRQAKVYVSVMGDETKQQLSLRGLQNSAGYLQSLVGKRIDTRYTPRLEFVLDLGVKRSIEISRILSEVLPPQSEETGELDAAELSAGDVPDEPLPAVSDLKHGDSKHSDSKHSDLKH